MIAVLDWTDGFGNDTYVMGIFPNLEEARKACEPIKANTSSELRQAKFQFGFVDWDWYEAPLLYPKRKQSHNWDAFYPGAQIIYNIFSKKDLQF